ncbi:MAG: triple tyrosine motif-containing protein [Bacteroidia bacterium]
MLEIHWLVEDSILCLRSFENELIFWDCNSERIVHEIILNTACSAFYKTGISQLSSLSENKRLIKIGPDLKIREIPIEGFPDFKASQVNGMVGNPSGNVLMSAESYGLFELSENSSGKLDAIKLNRKWNFPYYNLSSLFIDAEGMIWCSDQFNLFRINPDDFSWLRFSIENGNITDVSGVQFIQYQLKVIWITAYDGFLSFNTKQLEPSEDVPRPVLNSLIINGKKRNGFMGAEVQTINLKHDENSVSMNFAALEWNSPSEINYSYKLEGLDKNPHFAGNNHAATYIDIPPGYYTFHVNVTSAGGISKDFQLIRFRIFPAWWQTSLFRLFLITIALLSIFFSGRYLALAQLRRKLRKLEQDQKIHQVRNRIARDIHDEIGSGLTKINLLSRQLESSGTSETEKTKMIQKISSHSRNLIQNIAEIIWSVNPENDSVASTVSYMRDYIGKFFENTPVDHRTEVIVSSGISQESRINPEIKRNLIMIFKELLNNSLRHSKCTSVSFFIRFEETICTLIVTDNGIGPREIEDGKRGNGVRNIVKRLEEMQGKIEYSENSGTTATCTFTWRVNSY